MAHEELHLNLRNLTLDDYGQLQEAILQSLEHQQAAGGRRGSSGVTHRSSSGRM